LILSKFYVNTGSIQVISTYVLCYDVRSEIFRRTMAVPDPVIAHKTTDYFRIDMRISYRKFHPPHSWKLSLDIQNATNRVNQERPEYDLLRHEVIFDPQASINPVISYALDF